MVALESAGPELRDLSVVWQWVCRRKTIAGVIVALGLLAAISYSYLTPTIYHAQTTLILARGTYGQAAFGTISDLANITVSTARNQETLKRVAELSGIAIKFQANSLPDGFQAAVNANLIYLIVRGPAPADAALLANSWSQATREALAVRTQAIINEHLGTLDRNLAAIKQQLTLKQEERFNFERDSGINEHVDIDAHPSRLRLTELKELEAARQRVFDSLNAEQRLLNEDPVLALQELTRVGGNIQIQQKMRELEELRLKLRLAPAGDQSLGKEIALLQEALQASARTLVGEIKAESAALHQELKHTRAEIDMLTRALAQLRENVSRHKLLTTEIAAINEAYKRFSGERESTAAINQYDAFVTPLDQALVPAVPSVTPRWTRNLIWGLALSLLFALAGVFLAEHVDDTVRTAEELRDEAGIAALASLPRHADATFDAALARLQAGLERARSGAPDGHSVLTVLGPMAGAGASFIVAKLATLFAAQGRKVLVIDGDLRQRGLSTALECASMPGLSKALTENAAGQHVRHCGSFDVLPAGNAGSSALIDPVQLARLLEEIKHGYDLVLIDAPAVLSAAEALAFAKLSTATLLVARSGVTRQWELKEALGRLGTVRAENVFVAINDLN